MTISNSSPIQFSHQIHTQLNHENFLLWKSQILPVLRGHGLVSYIDGSKPPPTKHTTDAAGARHSNPEYELWHQQDQLILVWIFSSILSPILSQIVRCETSASAWTVLNQIHSSQSMPKILELKLQLQTAKKGNTTCAQFLQQMQNLADRLSIGTKILDSELVLYITQGLESEYESFIIVLSMREVTPSLSEFSSLLLAHEPRTLANHKASSNQVVHLTTHLGGSDLTVIENVVYYTNGFKQQNNNQNNTRGYYRGRRGNQRGRSRGRYYNSPKEQV
jgi:gag-polypeptide of LTR copia-type